ncbi:MAG: UvrB/UvrC motif-containing protein [Lentisphaeria bacterium]|nr:UvrB/UvrC motif-containing protein [Lentisphaeria bacterium]
MIRKRKIEPPHRTPVEVIDPDPELGLSWAQAEERVQAGWANGMLPGASRSEREIILGNCLTFFNFVFVALAVILMVGGASVKNLTFLVVVICNTVIGCYQEIKAKRTVDKLTLVAAQTVRTLREGKLAQIRSEALAARETPGSYVAKDGSNYTGKQQKKKRSNTVTRDDAEALLKKMGSDDIEDIITELERQMIEAAEALEFERAATIRDQIRDLRKTKD